MKMSIELTNMPEAISGKITGVETVKKHGEVEEIIQFFLEKYKKYIAQCIDYKDLLFYKYFCPQKRRAFRENAKLQGGESVTREMLECIISMTDISDRFTALVNLFEEEIENEKVLRILKGEKIPCNRSQNKERVQKQCMKEICENLQVIEIIPDLLKHGLILSREGDLLRTKARQETSFDAALELIQLLPSRHPNWYPRFLYCLINSGHQTIAEIVDENLCKKIISRTDLSSLDNNNNPKIFSKGGIIADEFEDMSLVSGPMKKNKSFSELLSHGTFELANDKAQTSDEAEGVPEPANILKQKDCFSQTENKEQTDDRDFARILQWLRANDNLEWKQTPKDTESQVEYSSGGTFCCSTEWSSRASDFSTTGNSRLDIDDDMSSSCTNTMYEGSIKSNSSFYEDDVFRVDYDSSQNEFSEDEVTKYRNIQRESEKKELQYQALELLFKKTNLHPVKICLILKQHPELLNTCQILLYVSRRSMQFKDDIFALRTHYILQVIRKARHAESLDEWIDKLLTGREIDGYYEFQDALIRHIVEVFPYKDSQLLRQLQKQLKRTPEGDGLTSFKILTQGLNGNPFLTDSHVQTMCSVCGEGHFESLDKQPLKEVTNKTGQDMCDCKNGDASLESMSGIVIDPMDPDSPEYRSIKENLQTTVEKGGRQCRVSDIKKIRNKVLRERYQHGMKEEISTKNDGKVNEQYLFHWSKSLRKVIENGYFGASREQMLLEGIYFADNPLLYVMDGTLDYRLRSMQCGCHRILLCRVSLGKSLHDSSSMQVDEIQKGHHFIKMYQRINDTCYTKYIVLCGEQVYPEYLVTFQTSGFEN